MGTELSTTDVWVISALINSVVFGALGAVAGGRKEIGAPLGFVFGFCLGVIGFVIVLVLRNGPPPAPEGMRAVRCPRCNTDQNVPKTATVSECWQCKQKMSLTA